METPVSPNDKTDTLWTIIFLVGGCLIMLGSGVGTFMIQPESWGGIIRSVVAVLVAAAAGLAYIIIAILCALSTIHENLD